MVAKFPYVLHWASNSLSHRKLNNCTYPQDFLGPPGGDVLPHESEYTEVPFVPVCKGDTRVTRLACVDQSSEGVSPALEPQLEVLSCTGINIISFSHFHKILQQILRQQSCFMSILNR